VLSADLERATEYNVRVQAMTVNGTGPATQWITAETFMHDLDGKPSRSTQHLRLMVVRDLVILLFVLLTLKFEQLPYVARHVSGLPVHQV